MNYNFNKHSNLSAAHKTATLMLKSFFNPKSALINTPVYQTSRNNQGIIVTIQFFYYQASQKISTNALKTLVSGLTEMYENTYGQPVIVELEAVVQSRPYMDAEILAHYLAINASKYGFNRMINFVLNAVPYIKPSQDHDTSLSNITGVKIQLAGLLTSQRNRSRKSVYTASAGTFHNNSQSTDNTQMVHVQYGSYTSKSRLGSFTVKIWLASTS